MIPTQKKQCRRTCQSRRDNGLRAPALGLARPDGTITGFSSQGTDYGGKQIELLGEIVPRLHRIGVIANAGSPGALGEMRAFEATAKALGSRSQVSKSARLRIYLCGL
jgi:ABC-type uncharacterized transport system substrate-binding protein